MDDNGKVGDDKSDLLAKANEEIYKQNFELAVRNKTLGTLKQLYGIAISTLEVKEVVQKMIDSIVVELNFSSALVFLTSEKEKSLKPIAITRTSQINEALESLGKPVEELVIPMDFSNNLAVVAVTTRERQITSNLLDILDPKLTQEQADAIANAAQIETIFVYPLFLGEKSLGVFIVALSKKADDLSRVEKETLEQAIDLVAIAIDRTQLHQDLKIANGHLQELDKLKDEFISIASHELRSPATVIKNYIWEAIHGESVPDKIKEELDKAYKANERLVALINDLLDVSRIESGRIELNVEKFDLGEVAGEVVCELGSKASDKAVSISLGSDKTGFFVEADKSKMHQVITNFVDNAIKFTPKDGQVTLIIIRENNRIRLEVFDNGIGIDEKEIERLFTKFGRLDTSQSVLGKVAGTGLGLYVSKKLVELAGGSIGAESTLGKGSKFYFEIPAIT